jgi:ABC-2 type transport system permease protein
VAFFCFLLRMPVSASDVAETFCVTAVLTLFLLATGNLLSIRFPRPVDPSQSWRTGSMGRVQGYLLFIYPVTAIPVLLAYGARYAFESNAAFFAVLAIDAAVGLIAYYIAMESASSMALESRESMIQALSNMEGPVGG